MGKATLKFYQIGQGDKTISIYDFMGVKYSQMFIQIKTLRGLEIIARWGPLPISMVLRLKSEMLSLARTSKYVNILVCKSNNSEEDMG